MPYELNMPIWT